MKTILHGLAILVVLLGRAQLGTAGESAAEDVPPPFYVQACFYGEPDPRYATAAQRMQLIRELGFAGYSHFLLDGLPEIQKAAEDNHLKLFQIYFSVSVDPEVTPKYDPRVKEVIAGLQGSETMIGLILNGKPPSTTEWDTQAVETVREIADLAAASGLRVAIYPHNGMWIERVQDAARVARKTERPNVGAVFSEVHFFLVDEEKNLEATLKEVAPYLCVVNINGTDGGASRELARVLQPLDRGSFDNLKLLKLLGEVGYRGPIGFHGYAIAGDVRENLAHTLEAWKRLSARWKTEQP